MVAHATGTPKGDEAEIRALDDVFAARVEMLPVSSIKGHIGHSGASAGGMGIITGVMAMHHGRFPHTAGSTVPDPEIRIDALMGEARAIDIEVLQVNAFGFGGQDASLVVTRS